MDSQTSAKFRPGGHLVRRAPIGAVDISRPHRGADALLAEKCGAREQEDALALGCPPSSDPAPRGCACNGKTLVNSAPLPMAICWLRRIASPMCGQYSSGSALSSQNASHPCAKQLAGQVVPSRCRAPRGWWRRRRAHPAPVRCFASRSLVGFGLGIEQAPDGDHRVHVFLVQGLEILAPRRDSWN